MASRRRTSTSSARPSAGFPRSMKKSTAIGRRCVCAGDLKGESTLVFWQEIRRSGGQELSGSDQEKRPNNSEVSPDELQDAQGDDRDSVRAKRAAAQRNRYVAGPD